MLLRDSINNFLKDRDLMKIEQLTQVPIIPVLRKIPYEKSDYIINALLEGGIRSIEITMDTERAADIINAAHTKYGSDISIGAGTVLTVEKAKEAIGAGAEFIVAPNFDEVIAKYAHEHEHNIFFVPGVFTPSEMVSAIQAGADMVKLFPASVLGPQFIKDVKGPLSHIPIMCTGGIDISTVKSYLEAGADAVGAGSSLVKKRFIEENDWIGLLQETKEWVASI